MAMTTCTGKRIIAITGRPGIGKTTIFIRVFERLQRDGYRITGFVCPEVRRGGRRIGFLIRSLDGKLERWLARSDGCDGPRVGRYYTCMEAVDVASHVLRQLPAADLVMIDEIGPMELRLPGIRSVIMEALKSGKPGIYVVHERLRDPEIEGILSREACTYTVTLENRDALPDEIYSAAKAMLQQR